MLRKIIHVDMDAFFAAVEQRDHPELRGRPVAVGGGGARGVVAAASYEARQFGVRSAMPSITARRKCPELIFVKARFEGYRQGARANREIFFCFTHLLEPLSFDEAHLHVTDNKKGIASATLIAEEIRCRIYTETELTASAGVSFNKFLAKIASDINKPNGIKVITPAEAQAFIDALPIEKFHGIGRVTAEKMHKLGIHTGADLKNWSEVALVQRFGKVGRHYYHIVRAQDNRAVNPHRIRKSIGAERTFSEDLHDPAAMKEKLTYLAGVVHEYMQKSENFGRTVTIKIKSADFKINTRSKSFGTEITRIEDLDAIGHELLDNNTDELGAVRLLGVSVSNLQKEHEVGGIQLRLEF